MLHRVQPLPEGGTAKCTRCGALLYRRKRNSLDRSLSMALAGLILFILCNTHPFLALKREGLVQQTTIITGVQELYRQDMWGLALLVLFTSILAPLIQLSGMLYVLLPLKFNRLPWMLPVVFRIQQKMQPWAMMEVFMLGILVSLVKLAKTATVVPGIALYAFVALIFVLAAASASLEPGVVWEKLEPIRE
ncbi:MAG: paraquat-inducible protein A [Desulfobacterales bacterium]|uniref:Paraquat-inducible protein A n=1 Tax=Candidatus Desulfatibia profunda TaxID=2841695 RepID=A0A8J6NVU1_9BACT|nr:paraquat-inducible protein A [Candidatus Desulfatibia profunda]MBL7180672.1 paraquat-inducible protein A [Desulfobacterales bacterium]